MVDKDDALKLAKRLAVEVPRIATSFTNGAWTEAVYQSLTAFKQEKSWKIFPPEKCYLGEYHCDFMLFEDGYGCRLACESQWQTFRSNAGELKWAFDKLRGVKSDVKLFIFEGPDTWRDDIREYLEGYAQLDPVETFVFMRWNHKRWELSWWKPMVAGIQTEAFSPIEF
jgi:hypothetical protein